MVSVGVRARITSVEGFVLAWVELDHPEGQTNRTQHATHISASDRGNEVGIGRTRQDRTALLVIALKPKSRT